MKRKTIFWHVVFWIVYMSIFTFVEAGYQNELKEAFLLEMTYLPLRLILVYFNYFILVPGFLLRKKIERYIIFSIVTILVVSISQRLAGYYVINPWLFPEWNDGNIFEPFRVAQAAMILTSPMIFLIGLTIVFRWADSEKKIERLARERVETELKYLKNQVNPHFFFNTLNNLYGLAQEKSDKTPEIVLKLSELMSYMLYETNKELIPISKEMDYIRNYVSLEEQRYGNRFKCSIKVKGSVRDIMIPPMLILPFIENSFKHGINQESEGAWIKIDLLVEGNKLVLEVKNSVVIQTEPPKMKGGLGIKNVERRLELLYPKGFKLNYAHDKQEYHVRLELQLNRLALGKQPA